MKSDNSTACTLVEFSTLFAMLSLISDVSVSPGETWLSCRIQRGARIFVGSVCQYFFITDPCDLRSHFLIPRTSGLGALQDFDFLDANIRSTTQALESSILISDSRCSL